MKKETKISLLQTAYQLLKDKKGYSQASVVKKLDVIGFSTNTTAFNHLVKNRKDRISAEVLAILYAGLQELLAKELCLQINEQQLVWEAIEDCKPVEIATKKANHSLSFKMHSEGRLDIADKVRFFSTAQKEVIEFGMTLNTFSNYFTTRRASEFKIPVRELLEKGVDFKCYLLDPNWAGTLLYLEDCKSGVKEGVLPLDKIKGSLGKLQIIYEEFSAANLKGKFEVFTYRHIPHNYFLALDKSDSQNGKMMVSNYLYGMKRADCPVMEFTRAKDFILFRRYLDSLNKIIQGAKKVDFKD